MGRVPLVAGLLALASSGCGLVSCEHVDRGRLDPEPAAASELPRAFAPDLPAAAPATEVIVRADRIEVRNDALVATWPAAAKARARTASEGPEWPRVAHLVEDPAEGFAMPELRAALERSRRAERAATGAGTGASAFNLRVASDVPYERVERVLYAAGQAGYGAPRVLLAAGETERMLPWPRARSAGAPSREVIEAALRGAPSAVTRPHDPRIRLDGDRASASHGKRAVCAVDLPLAPPSFEPCVRALRAAGERLTIEVGPGVRFERVTALLQVVRGAFVDVRVVRSAPR